MTVNVQAMSILLVDDDVETRSIFELVMAHHQLPLHAVGTAQAALDYLKNNRPTVVVLDLVLPDKDGYRLFRHMRQLLTAKFVATSAYYTSDTEAQILAWGFDGFLPKPLSPSKLVAYLQAMVQG